MSTKKAMVVVLPVDEALQLVAREVGSGQGRRGLRHHQGVQGGRVHRQANRGAGQRQRKKGQARRHQQQQRHHQGHQHHQQPAQPQQQGALQAQEKAALSDPVPLWNDHQLIGDSILSRFFCKVEPSKTQATYDPKLNCKCLGYVVHGQTTGQLLRRLKVKGGGGLHKKVLVLIGTNDVTKGVPMSNVIQNLKEILIEFQKLSIFPVFCTIPPIPKLKESCEVFNTILRGVVEQKATVIDISGLFKKSDGGINSNLFQMKHPSGKVDGVHPNTQGLLKMSKQIEVDLSAVLSIDEEMK